MFDRPPFTLDDLLNSWERVATNAGCAGVDRVSIQIFAQRDKANCAELLQSLLEGRYRPLPLLRILVEKSPGAKLSRTLLVPTIADRILQTAAAQAMSKSYEEEFLDASFAYRPGRGVDRAIARLRQLRDQGFEYVFDADIRKFFDSVRFDLLEQQLLAQGEPHWLLSLISQWIKAPFWDGRRLRARHRGLPQGSPISPLLANIFLSPLDVALASLPAKLVRYADDFLVLTDSPDSLALAVTHTTTVLSRLGLEINPAKSTSTSFSEGFRFLGVYFHKDEIWRPWRDQPKSTGRILAMARPMPPSLLAPFRAPPSPQSWEKQLQSQGLRWRTPKSLSSPETNPVAYLYLTHQGAVLRKSGDRFLVEAEEKIVLDIPYDKLEHILIFGNVQVTTQALGELLDKGVDLSFFTWRGQFRGSLSPPRSANIKDRLAQMELWRDSTKSLALAQAIVAAKIANQHAVLHHLHLSAHPAPPIPPSPSPLPSPLASSLPELMGQEGAAARDYFTAFGRFVPPPFLWSGRKKRPAPDPVNALLSLAYTLVTQELGSLAESEGLEVALGHLHQLDHNRPSLALDLVEPFRAPIADRFVLAALRQSLLSPNDFAPVEGGGLLLSPPALRRFLEAYEQWMLAQPRAKSAANRPSYRSLLRAEVRHYLAALRGHPPFSPYRFSPDSTTSPCAISSLTI